MYNDQLVYNVVIWVFFKISLLTEKVALRMNLMSPFEHYLVVFTHVQMDTQLTVAYAWLDHVYHSSSFKRFKSLVWTVGINKPSDVPFHIVIGHFYGHQGAWLYTVDHHHHNIITG